MTTATRSILRGLPVRRAGFTLVELLVVVLVILVLVGLTLGIGRLVIENRRETATSNVMFSLDKALEEYRIVKGRYPDYDPDGEYQYLPGPGNRVETYAGGTHIRLPDAKVFFKQIKGYGAADTIVNQIPPRFLKLTPYTGAGTNDSQRLATNFPSVLDAWSNADRWADPWPIGSTDANSAPGETPILLVHPQNILAQDLFGKCLNGKPYFLAADDDRKYGLRSEFPGQSSGDALTAAEAAATNNLFSYQPGPFRKGMTQR
ncbi:MAG: prepilin-type N-terminal cleavage/methylation domain-containing protein [Phycisphaerales bacterium]|nr:prepilin-type N-terminal cleavage/methylation domain-containing protein [Phycisphaerales bacterium]